MNNQLIKKKSNDLKISHNNNNTSISYSPKSLMFGTFETICDLIKLTTKGIEFNAVNTDFSSNNVRRYDVKIPFKQIIQLFYCFDKLKPSLFIKTSLLTNQEIQKSLFPKIEPRIGLKFDVNSPGIKRSNQI